MRIPERDRGGRRVLMLGLDAADHDLVQRLMREGRMPRLAALASRGSSGRLASPADLYAGGVWPTFYTGRHVADHGVYHNKQWRPESMRVEVPAEHWTNATPFWERWHDAGFESLIVDVPMVLGRPRPLRGAYLGGWGTHDLICRGSWPPGLWSDLHHRFGAPVMPPEAFGWQSAASLVALQQMLRHATGQLRDVAVDLMNGSPWRFACIVFGSLHRGGHYLWDRSQIDTRSATRVDDHAPTPALVDLYSEVDAAVGTLIDLATPDTTVIAFAVHGMGPNPGWSDLLPEILTQAATRISGQAPRRGALYRLRRRLPHHWVRPLLQLLPLEATQSLVEIWSRRMYDWSSTRHFPMPMDEAGYLRVNLKGRERDGIVDPGDAAAVCADLVRLLVSLHDAATGQPITGTPVWAHRDADPAAPGRRLLPDLVVPWTDARAATTRRLASSLLPGFIFDVPPRLPSGRSGNHRAHGWFIAAGPGIVPGVAAGAHHVVDLLPTLQRCLGLEVDSSRPGCAIREIAGP